MDILENAIVIGGTGRFLDASGMFTYNGLLRGTVIDGVRGGELSGTFQGTIDVPAVPEPATWMSMILGFGVVGAVVRRRKQVVSIAA